MQLFRPLVIGALPLMFSPTTHPGRMMCRRNDRGRVYHEAVSANRPHARASSARGLWHSTDFDADWSIEYRGDEAGDWEVPLPSSRRVAVLGVEPHRVYRAALTNLSPGRHVPLPGLEGGRSSSRPRLRAPEVGRPTLQVRGLRRLRSRHHRAKASRPPGLPVRRRFRVDPRRYRL